MRNAVRPIVFQIRHWGLAAKNWKNYKKITQNLTKQIKIKLNEISFKCFFHISSITTSFHSALADRKNLRVP